MSDSNWFDFDITSIQEKIRQSVDEASRLVEDLNLDKLQEEEENSDTKKERIIEIITHHNDDRVVEFHVEDMCKIDQVDQVIGDVVDSGSYWNIENTTALHSAADDTHSESFLNQLEFDNSIDPSQDTSFDNKESIWNISSVEQENNSSPSKEINDSWSSKLPHRFISSSLNFENTTKSIFNNILKTSTKNTTSYFDEPLTGDDSISGPDPILERVKQNKATGSHVTRQQFDLTALVPPRLMNFQMNFGDAFQSTSMTKKLKGEEDSSLDLLDSLDGPGHAHGGGARTDGDIEAQRRVASNSSTGNVSESASPLVVALKFILTWTLFLLQKILSVSYTCICVTYDCTSALARDVQANGLTNQRRRAQTYVDGAYAMIFSNNGIAILFYSYYKFRRYGTSSGD